MSPTCSLVATVEGGGQVHSQIQITSRLLHSSRHVQGAVPPNKRISRQPARSSNLHAQICCLPGGRVGCMRGVRQTFYTDDDY